MSPYVGRSVGWLVGLSVIIFNKDEKLHFHAPIGALDGDCAGRIFFLLQIVYLRFHLPGGEVVAVGRLDVVDGELLGQLLLPQLGRARALKFMAEFEIPAAIGRGKGNKC